MTTRSFRCLHWVGMHQKIVFLLCVVTGIAMVTDARRCELHCCWQPHILRAGPDLRGRELLHHCLGCRRGGQVLDSESPFPYMYMCCVLYIGTFSSRKDFRWPPSTSKIKPTKCFLWRINGLTLNGQVVKATRIKPGENLTDKIFYQRKIPNLQYLVALDLIIFGFIL